MYTTKQRRHFVAAGRTDVYEHSLVLSRRRRRHSAVLTFIDQTMLLPNREIEFANEA